MIQYGYLLPKWIPLMTRYMCYSATGFETHGNFMDVSNNFNPYSAKCFIHEYEKKENDYAVISSKLSAK